jgi:hypothetical protein
MVRRPGLSLEGKNLAAIIKDNQLEKWLRVNTRRGVSRLAVVDRLLLNCVSFVDFGFNQGNQLFVVASDVRKEKNAMLTIEKLV